MNHHWQLFGSNQSIINICGLSAQLQRGQHDILHCWFAIRSNGLSSLYLSQTQRPCAAFAHSHNFWKQCFYLKEQGLACVTPYPLSVDSFPPWLILFMGKTVGEVQKKYFFWILSPIIFLWNKLLIWNSISPYDTLPLPNTPFFKVILQVISDDDHSDLYHTS